MKINYLDDVAKGKGFAIFDNAQTVAAINVSGCADYSRKKLDELTNWVKRPQIGAKGNPVFMLFFERDSRDMQRLTGGNALFFRSRIRHTIAATDVKDIKINYNNQEIAAKEISFQPFTKTELKNRVSRYKTKKFIITMSEEIPGVIFKIEAFIKDLENPDDMVKEILEFQGIRTNKELREEYKKRKDKNKS